MRPDTYDTLIDSSIELSKYSGWFLLSLIIGGMFLSLVALALIGGFDIQVYIPFLYVLDFVLSFTLIILMFMIKKARLRFDVKRWRDCWMAFGHPVKLHNAHDKQNEIDTWIYENIPRLHRRIKYDGSLIVIFKNKSDAMAFKLRWI